MIPLKISKHKLKVAIRNEKLLEVGCNIRKWRHLKGMKQEALADELEISKVSISKIETGKTDIPLNRLYEIAAVLEINIQLLFSDPLFILRPGDKILK